MPLRILFVTDVYPPLIGGAELQMQLLSQKLQQRSHKVAVATNWQVGLPKREDDEGVSVYRLKGLALRVPWFSSDPHRRHHPPMPDPGTVWELRRIIRRFQPDVIHAYGWITYSCTIALTGMEIPMLLSVRDYGYTCALRTKMRYGKEYCSGPAPAKCLDCATNYFGTFKGMVAVAGVFSGRYLLRRKTSGIQSVSTYMQQVTRDELFDTQEQVCDGDGRLVPDVVIHSSHDSADDSRSGGEASIQPYLALLPDQPYILFVGALRLVKGLEPLFAAYQRLNAPPPLVLIGRVSSDTPKVFPPSVSVLYDFPHSAVMAAYERALFTVVPSVWPEPSGNVIHEAMSKGKAVIGTTPGGQTDMIVEGETGLIVPAIDVAALADAMQKLLAEPELRERMGEAGRQRAKLFAVDIMVPRFEQLYRQLVANSKG